MEPITQASAGVGLSLWIPRPGWLERRSPEDLWVVQGFNGMIRRRPVTGVTLFDCFFFFIIPSPTAAVWAPARFHNVSVPRTHLHSRARRRQGTLRHRFNAGTAGWYLCHSNIKWYITRPATIRRAAILMHRGVWYTCTECVRQYNYDSKKYFELEVVLNLIPNVFTACLLNTKLDSFLKIACF